MSFSVLPPEINSAQISTGAGPEPLMAAATAWGGLADELEAAATSFGSVTAGLVGGSWLGPSAAEMMAAAAPYAGWLSATAAQARQTATQAGALVAEFEAVRSAVVQPIMVAANRSNLVSLVLSNLFGQNAPAIASVEAASRIRWPAQPGQRPLRPRAYRKPDHPQPARRHRQHRHRRWPLHPVLDDGPHRQQTSHWES
ncbi:PPE family protein [Mycobacterium simiae]|uniref:PPE family protein n=1 Tax=Mycobacterium simiae TaxID=1784 RepID=A0A5B1BK47_MYCSI|nr:PPE family protein [Mycobacterium simiae]KAA1248341.1 PPE family protein [Mycobacterium simiae]